MIKGDKAVNIYFILEVFIKFYSKANKGYSWLRGGDLLQASSWFRVRKAGPFSIPDQVEVVSSVPGEVVVGNDVFFFLHHAFLVFFGGIDGAGVGSSVSVTFDLPFFVDLFEHVWSSFANVFKKDIRLSFWEGVTSTSLIFWGFGPNLTWIIKHCSLLGRKSNFSSLPLIWSQISLAPISICASAVLRMAAT